MSGRIIVKRAEDKFIGEIIIDHPERRNAITARMAGEFCAAMTSLEQNNNIKVIVISGSGTDLTVGADATEIAARFKQQPDAPRQRPVNQRIRFDAANLWWGADGVFRRVLQCPKVTITAAQGACFEAGLYFALYADLTIASETAVFGNPHWRHVGVNGDISMLIAAVGLKRAKDLIYCGSEWTAHEAVSYGLIDGVTKPRDHAAAIAKLTNACALIMRDAVQAEKQVVLAALARMQIDTGLAAAAVVGGWGTNIHFRDGEFNFLRQAQHDGLRAALQQGRDHFGG
jgi:enoyl-CoA hydratase/carnithine racemase